MTEPLANGSDRPPSGAPERPEAPPAPDAMASLPQDARERLASLPPWLRGVAAAAYPTPERVAQASRAERERAEADRAERFRRLRATAEAALAGDYGKAARAACENACPLQPDGSRMFTASALALCGSIVEEAKQRKASESRTYRGRGAP